MSSDNGDIAADLGAAIETQTPGKTSGVSSDVSLIFEHDASAERSHISVDVSPNSNAAAEAGRFRNAVCRPNGDVVTKLCSIVRPVGQGGGRKCSQKDYAS